MTMDAGPSSQPWPVISGNNPGLLDPSQRTRLMRSPDSVLTFASFDPHTAAAHESQETLKDRSNTIKQDLYNSKRIVIETTSTGDQFWRFVPRARRDEGIEHEGQWPRLVELCGQQVVCSQEQWDIHKLDPVYTCRVRAPPALTTITKAPPRPQKPPLEEHLANGKRAMRDSPSSAVPHPRRRRLVSTPPRSSSPENDDIEEVERMAVDDYRDIPGKPSAFKTRKHKAELNRNREERRQKLASRTAKLNPVREDFGTSFEQFTAKARSVPPPSLDVGKRKASNLYGSISPQDETGQFLRGSPSLDRDMTRKKRVRTTSPSSTPKGDYELRRKRREKEKRERHERERQVRKEAREAQFLQEIIAEAPEEDYAMHGSQSQNTYYSNDTTYEPAPAPEEQSESSEDELPAHEADTSDDEDAEREAAIAESRRKLAELEQDRPIWERAAKERAASVQAEVEAEARRRRHQEEQQRRARLEAEERLRRQREAQEREKAEHDKEEALRKERERQARNERWNHGTWTTKRALERYKMVCVAFDAKRYTLDDPLKFDAVPWPVLNAPSDMNIEDISWDAVEKFFAAARQHMKEADYRPFIEKSHRRFHPDRWRSRGLLRSILDESERGCMEVGANTVAQALTPLWKSLRV